VLRVCSRVLPWIVRRLGALRALPSFPTRRSSDLPEDIACFVKAEIAQSVPRQKSWLFRGRRRLTALPPQWPALRCPLHNSSCSLDRKSTRLNSSHVTISYAVFCLKKKIAFTTEPP